MTDRERISKLWEVLKGLTPKDLNPDTRTVALDYLIDEFAFLLRQVSRQFSVWHVYVSDDEKTEWTGNGPVFR